MLIILPRISFKAECLLLCLRYESSILLVNHNLSSLNTRGKRPTPRQRSLLLVLIYAAGQAVRVQLAPVSIHLLLFLVCCNLLNDKVQIILLAIGAGPLVLNLIKHCLNIVKERPVIHSHHISYVSF